MARTIVLENDKILLVKNKNAIFWYPPGGGWEYESETIVECAVREVAEETGYKVEVGKLLWVQEFHEDDKVSLETFWLANISSSNTQNASQLKQHVDLDASGETEEIGWFTQEELQNLKVFPERIKSIHKLATEQEASDDPFMGIFSQENEIILPI